MTDISDLVLGNVYSTSTWKDHKGCNINVLYLGKFKKSGHRNLMYLITYKGEHNKLEIFGFTDFEIKNNVLNIKGVWSQSDHFRKSEEEYITQLLKKNNLWNRT
jgi:hypothetical protein